MNSFNIFKKKHSDWDRIKKRRVSRTLLLHKNTFFDTDLEFIMLMFVNFQIKINKQYNKNFIIGGMNGILESIEMKKKEE